MKKKMAVVAFFISFLLAITGCQERQSCASMEELFSENRQAFQQAADTMLKYPCQNCLWVESEDTKNDRVATIQIGDLFFTTTDGFLPNDSYVELFAAVDPLFQNNAVCGIAYNSYEIQFAVQSNMGVESSIIYSYKGRDPTGSFPTIIEKRLLDENWYAIVVSD